VLRTLQEFGPPVCVPLSESRQFWRRRELAARDSGWMASRGFEDKGQSPQQLYALFRRNPAHVFFADASPLEIERFIRSSVPESRHTFGFFLIQKLGMAGFLTLSTFTDYPRFVAPFAVTSHYILETPELYHQLSNLAPGHWARFIELVSYTAQFLAPVVTIPKQGISAMMNTPLARNREFSSAMSLIHEAALLPRFYAAVFGCPECFYPFFGVVRSRMHDVCAGLARALSNSTFQKGISDGLKSSDHNIHFFCATFLRIALSLDSAPIVRALASFDWITTINSVLLSASVDARANAISLSSLLFHSSGTLILKRQFLLQSESPTAFIAAYFRHPARVQRFILDVISSFGRRKHPFEYVPVPAETFRRYLAALSRDVGADPDSAFGLARRLIRLYIRPHCIAVQTIDELLPAVTRFAAAYIPMLVARANTAALSCMKTMLKVRYADTTFVNTFDVWEVPLRRMVDPKVPARLRVIAWKVFRNGILFQPRFGAFLISSPEIAPLFDQAFAPADNDRTWKVLRLAIIERLARAANGLNFVDGAERGENLSMFFSKLAAPEMRFLPSLQRMEDKQETRRMVESVWAEIARALPNSPLVRLTELHGKKKGRGVAEKGA
jgi:hypothetical protein